MRKIIFGVIAFFGLAIIGTGVFLSINKQEEKKEEKEPVEEKKLVVLNDFDLKTVCTESKKVKTFLYDNEGNRYNITYPDCVHEFNKTTKYKTLSEEYYGDNIKMEVRHTTKNYDKFVNDYKIKYISYKSSTMYTDVKYSDVYKSKTKKGYTYKAINCNYKLNSLFSNTYYYEWALGIKINEDISLTLYVTSKNQYVPFEVIKDMIDSISFESDKANYNNTKEENGRLVGELTEKVYKDYSKEIKIKLNLPTTYPELATTSTNYNYSCFELDKVKTRVYFSYSIESTYSNNVLESAKSTHEYYKKTYTDPEKITGLKDTFTTKVINKKTFYYSEIYYKRLDKDKKPTSEHYKILYTQDLGNSNFLRITVELDNVKPSDKLLNEILNYEVEYADVLS